MKELGALIISLVLTGCASAPSITDAERPSNGTIKGDADFNITHIDYKKVCISVFCQGKEFMVAPGKHTVSTETSHPTGPSFNYFHPYPKRAYTFTIQTGYSYEIISSPNGNHEEIKAYKLSHGSEYAFAGYLNIRGSGGNYYQIDSQLYETDPCRFSVNCNCVFC